MRINLACLLLLMIAYGCDERLQPVEDITSWQEKFVTNALGEDGARSDQLLAGVLMGHFSLHDTLLNKLEKYAVSQNDDRANLLSNYVLAIQTQERQFMEGFVAAYPEGEALAALHEEIRKSDLLSATSPFQNLLAFYAIDNDLALTKLMQAMAVLDGADAEALDEQLLRLYQNNSERFGKLAATLSLELKELINIDNN